MYEAFKLIGTVSAVTGIVLTAFVALGKYLGQRWIDASFKSKEEEAKRLHEERLQEANARHQESLENYKHQLKMLEQRESIVFEREHAESLAMVKRAYQALVNYSHLWEFVADDASPQKMAEQYERIRAARKEFSISSLLAAPYLPQQHTSDFEELLGPMADREDVLRQLLAIDPKLWTSSSLLDTFGNLSGSINTKLENHVVSSLLFLVYLFLLKLLVGVEAVSRNFAVHLENYSRRTVEGLCVGNLR